MKYLVLVSAVCMQMCLGATYSWSVFVQPLKDLTGLLQAPVQIPFTVFYFTFPISMLIAGHFLEAIGTRRSAMIGGVLFGGGWLVAGFGNENFLITVLGVGLLGGIGAGMAYIVPISVCIRWFPSNKGLVTGIAVAGFGGGAALVSQIAGFGMSKLGFSPFQLFTFLGIIFMCTVFLAGTSMRLPKEDAKEVKHSKRIKVQEILGHPRFYLLYLAMFAGLSAGFTVNANLKEMFGGTEDSVIIGITAISIFALANAAGRISWGAIFDKISAATAIRTNLFLQAAVFLCAPLLLDSVFGFYLVALLSGFNYGGVLVVYVSSVSRLWGTDKVSHVYGWLFSSNIPASFMPLLAGLFFDIFNNFNMAFVFSACLLLGCGLWVGLKKEIII